MFDTSVYPYSIYISTIQTKCMTLEFNSTYPLHLAGIINRDEYRESIDQINRTMSSNIILFIVAVVFGLGLIIGMIFIIIGLVLQENTNTVQFPPLIGAGIAMLFCGSMFALIGCFIIQYRRTKRMQQAIAKESMKYSSRTPIPCNWTLETRAHCLGTYDDGQYQRLVYRIVIDIGCFATSGNVLSHSDQIATETTSLIRQENDLPPPYSSLSTQFCS